MNPKNDFIKIGDNIIPGFVLAIFENIAVANRARAAVVFGSHAFSYKILNEKGRKICTSIFSPFHPLHSIIKIKTKDYAVFSSNTTQA